MIDKSCRISLPCGINNKILIDSEQIAALNPICLIYLLSTVQGMVIPFIIMRLTSHQLLRSVSLHPHILSPFHQLQYLPWQTSPKHGSLI